MRKTDLVNMLVENGVIETKRQATEVVDRIFGTIKDEVALLNEVDITGFGKFLPVHKKARNGVNPSTGKSIVIKERTSVRFQPYKAFKDLVNK